MRVYPALFEECRIWYPLGVDMFQGFYETGLGGKPGIGFDIGDFPSVVGSESLDQSKKGLKSGMSISAFRRWRYNPEDLIDARFANCALRYIVSSMRSGGFLDKHVRYRMPVGRDSSQAHCFVPFPTAYPVCVLCRLALRRGGASTALKSAS